MGLDLDKFRQPWTETSSDQRANIIGQDGYSKPVNLGEVPNHGKREKFGFKFPVFGCQLCALMFQAQGNCNCSREHGKRAMLKSVPWHDLTPFFICFSGKLCLSFSVFIF